MSITIITNNHERFFTYGIDVPAAIMADQFDHLDEDESTDGFIYYRNYWYHTSDFMVLLYPEQFSKDTSGLKQLIEWHGYASDSAFSGVLISISDDCETYRIATYTS